MRIKKFIKLINNERTKSGFVSAKACDQSSDDICVFDDYAACVVNSFDLCNKDHAGCFNNSEDICGAYRDTYACGNYSTDHT